MSQPNPPRGTTIPAVFDLLMTGLDTVDPTVPVLDGMPPQWPKSDAIAIGVSVPGQPGISRRATLDQRTLGYREPYDITCAIWSWGDKNATMKEVRDRAWGLHDGIRTWVDANYDLGGLVDRITMGDFDAAVPRNRGDGPEYTIGFMLHVAADI